jgi:hypothetical protein
MGIARVRKLKIVVNGKETERDEPLHPNAGLFGFGGGGTRACRTAAFRNLEKHEKRIVDPRRQFPVP